jgi:hypothetical protein
VKLGSQIIFPAYNSTGEQQGVELIRTGLVEGHVNRNVVTPLGELPASNSPLFGRDNASFSSTFVEGLARLGQFHLLETIRN